MPARRCHPRPPNRGGGRHGEQPPGCSAPVSSPPSPVPALCVCVCPPRPRVLRSPPALAAAVTCHRVPLSPPRRVEMAATSGRSRVAACREPTGAQPLGDGSVPRPVTPPARSGRPPCRGGTHGCPVVTVAFASCGDIRSHAPTGDPEGWRVFGHAGVTAAVPDRGSPPSATSAGGETEAGRAGRALRVLWGPSPAGTQRAGPGGVPSSGAPAPRGRARRGLGARWGQGVAGG